MPSHIGASCHLLYSQGHRVYILRCNHNSLEWIPIQCVPRRIPMRSHGSSLPLPSLSSTMWKHSLSNRIRQVPWPSVAQLWQHEGSPPFFASQTSTTFRFRTLSEFPSLISLNPTPFDNLLLRATTNSVKLGLFI